MATLARWNRTIQDGAGNALNATITVYKESDGLIATIYSDRAGATPKSNPFTLSSADQGYAYFHAVGGAYKVVATYGSYTQTWRYEPVGTGAEFDADSLSGVTAPTTTVPAAVQIADATNNGSNYIQITVPAALAANYTFTLPAADVTMSTYAATLIAAASASAARTVLGLGTSAVIDTGTSGTKVALTDGANTWSAQQTFSASFKYATVANFTPLHNQPPASNYATLDTRNGHAVLDFDTTTQETAIFGGIMPNHYGAGSIRVTIWASLTSATSGTLGWDIAFETDNGQDIDSDGFNTAKTATAATVPGTSGVMMTHQVTFSQSEADGIAAGDAFRLRIRRDVANDNAAGDAELFRVLVELV